MILSVIGMALNVIYQQLAWLFSYITNNNVFPLPLSEEEERALILRWKREIGLLEIFDRAEPSSRRPYREKFDVRRR